MAIKFGSHMQAVHEMKAEHVKAFTEKVNAAFMKSLGGEKHDPAVVIYCVSQLLCSCIRASIPEEHKAEFDSLVAQEQSGIDAAHHIMLLAGMLSPMGVMARLFGAAEQESCALMSIVTIKAVEHGGAAL